MHALSRFGYKLLNNCTAPAPDSDDVLVVEEEAFLCAGHAKETTTKTSSLPGAGAAQLLKGKFTISTKFQGL